MDGLNLKNILNQNKASSGQVPQSYASCPVTLQIGSCKILPRIFITNATPTFCYPLHPFTIDCQQKFIEKSSCWSPRLPFTSNLFAKSFSCRQGLEKPPIFGKLRAFPILTQHRIYQQCFWFGKILGSPTFYNLLCLSHRRI